LKVQKIPGNRENLSRGHSVEYWSYRVGDYRLLATIEDDIMTIIIVKIGNCREVYDR
jgi:mRNA-degrading endonuclease RelE of RelBE toxin-antitoxin system